MSVEKVTRVLYHCKCDHPSCGKEWDSDHIPERCSRCQRRTWNRPARLSSKQPLTFNGETMSVAAWSRKLNLAKTTIPWRIKEGWPLEQVLSNEDWRWKEPKTTT